jgi:hypothetical protein
MESSLVMDDSGWSIIDPDGPTIALAEPTPDVIASVMASVIAASPDVIAAGAFVVCAAGVVALAQAVSGTAISASRANERRIHRP